ncbi:hypothetical protein LIA77_06444 [Sarocladium implicatum]|nr:hypothetical protein LIA77_06444 [Sarocladium implicatum]
MSISACLAGLRESDSARSSVRRNLLPDKNWTLCASPWPSYRSLAARGCRSRVLQPNPPKAPPGGAISPGLCQCQPPPSPFRTIGLLNKVSYLRATRVAFHALLGFEGPPATFATSGFVNPHAVSRDK